MATGYDKLLDFLLAEIALCGTQGAGSADLVRFIEKYYEEDDASTVKFNSSNIGRKFLEKIWGWVSKHPDIRISNNGQIGRLSLPEFEAAELAATGKSNGVKSTTQSHATETPILAKPQPSESLLSLREALRQRLSEEGVTVPLIHQSPVPTESQDNEPVEITHDQGIDSINDTIQRPPRPELPENASADVIVFDEPSATINGPRLYASQNRVWQALTGHGMDLKKVPSMEFVLLSIIAAHGSAGITQPELTQLSGQDKRSVPKRTDELARKGYIVKNPVQSGKIRTSLCIHIKFTSQDQYQSADVDDVFQQGTFVVAGFVHLLYNKLKDSDVVPTRELRTRLGVPIRTWNMRAVQGVLIRLDQSGMIKRCRVRKKAAEEKWVICVRILREPRPEDVENLGFRRQVLQNAPIEEYVEDGEDDDDADTLMKDLEVDILDDNEATEVDNQPTQDARRRPQWVPERLLSNIIFDVTASGLDTGVDGLTIRDSIIGSFWKRPMETYLSRLTDDWRKSQPPHLLHLSVIRDTRTTNEKRFIHYVYRTYENFKIAVEAGEVSWEGVSKSGTKSAGSKNAPPALNQWGFLDPNKKHLLRPNGSASLKEARSVIVNNRYGPRWSHALTGDGRSPKAKQPSFDRIEMRARLNTYSSAHNLSRLKSNDSRADSENEGQNNGVLETSMFTLNLTPEERIRIGLKPLGRISDYARRQIMSHRQMTGDPTSLPDRINEPPPKTIPIGEPLMSTEERIAANLPPKGRLGVEVENRIRAERGLPKIPERKKKKSRASSGPTVLSKQQRIALGLKPHGRLHQDFIDALRKEREDDIPLEESPAVKAYLETLRLKEEMATEGSQENQLTSSSISLEAQPTSPDDTAGSVELSQVELLNGDRPLTVMSSTNNKRKAGKVPASQASKKQRTQALSSAAETMNVPSPPIETNDTPLPPRMLPAPTAASSSFNADTEHEHIDSLVESSRPTTPTSRRRRQVETMPRTIQYSLEDGGIQRDSSGLYIYPSAKRNMGRGRPRKACVVVFRLPSLHTLDWFEKDAEELQEESIDQPFAQNEKAMHNDDQSSAVAPSIIDPEVALPNTTQRLVCGECIDVDVPDAKVLSSDHIGTTGNAPINEKVPTQPLGKADDQDPNAMALDPSLSQPTSRYASPIADGTLGKAESTSRSDMVPSLRPVAGLSLSHASTPASGSPYQSPYAPGLPVLPRRQSGARETPDAMNLSRDAGAPTPLDGNAPVLPEGVVGAPAEVDNRKKNSAKSRPRGPGGLAGSHVKFRQAIIQDIIDRCGGVYPMHGEIWRPFSALWDQRHGHTKIKKPINSTVFDTLRDMIEKPEFNLKRMSFYVKARNSLGAKQRVMVARKDILPSDPRVLKLAYNMANNSLEKSHQYFPEQVRDLFDHESSYIPIQIAPKDDSFALDQLYPELEANILENRRRRRAAKTEQKRLEKAAAKAQNERVEEALPGRRDRSLNDGPREKRMRLASLNDKNKRYRRAPLQVPSIETDTRAQEERREPSPTGSDSSEDMPLSQLHTKPNEIRGDSGSGNSTRVEESAVEVRAPSNKQSHVSSTLMPDTVSFTHPIVYFQSFCGTFATSFSLDVPLSLRTSKSTSVKKSVRIEEPIVERAPEGSHIVGQSRQKESLDSEFVYNLEEDSDATSSEDEEENVQVKQIQPRKRKASSKRQLGKKLPPPTLLERLTGLTGDPNDPIWMDPKQGLISYRAKPWAQRKRHQKRSQQRERQYVESLDPVDKFKRLLCTMVLASCMSGSEDVVLWNIVAKIYTRDKFFDLAKVKKLWTWMQKIMTTQLTELKTLFQSHFLEAYEKGRIPEIEDPETYDWAGVVRWMMRTCPYPEIPLAMQQRVLNRFDVDESSYTTLNRSTWYGKTLADSKRTQLQYQVCFATPMHRREKNVSNDDMVLKARSWTRANIATQQSSYNANKAHDKLKVLGENTLVKVVEDLVLREQLKMRKLKRQLPGRNYTFTKKIATAYRRPLELDHFIAAAHIKKQLDGAFANADPNKRLYSLQRSEDDGAVMAIMSLHNAGQVKLVPKLPRIDHEFGAPLPRLSRWGFCEGDYNHRAIDRGRYFWDVHIEPTPHYKFGNPLQPLPSPLEAASSKIPLEWAALPDPPMPGKSDPSALLPIWSSIDGQTITWSWWYRILNLVLQPLYRQPGATAVDIHAHCVEHTTERFEIQLVLDWLENVGAVSKLSVGGYQVTPHFWAVFGDRLHDTEDDWFGAHVKRRTNTRKQQAWRERYNKQFSKELAEAHRGSTGAQSGTGGSANELGNKILNDSRNQYGIFLSSLHPGDEGVDADAQSPNATKGAVAGGGSGDATGPTMTDLTQETHSVDEAGDTQMMDLDAIGDEDVDAL